ncbi:ABC transporter permease subunit [Vibrio sonorensis]|uniref:ABC transporter permease subunit n=1 Tax=Vibrio sonorensis TaxID=1004316 RepID=UPI0008DAFB2A|nr:ABC transporter permease subunit [Vibrio sonorensis]
MAVADFSLKEPDRKRLIKDRLFRLAVSSGGVGVLAALVLIFVYLALMVLPLFKDAGITPDIANRAVNTSTPLAMGIDDYGEHAYLLYPEGNLDFVTLSEDSGDDTQTHALGDEYDLFYAAPSSSGWLAMASSEGDVKLVRPHLTSRMSSNGREFVPKLETYPLSEPVLQRAGVTLKQFAFALQDDVLIFAGAYSDDRIEVRWMEEGRWSSYLFSMPVPQLDQIFFTPNGKLLYLLSGSELIIANRESEKMTVREIVDLSLGESKHSVSNIDLLSGAHSLLVTHNDGLVSQWFDVVRNGQRHLTHIREFKLASELQFLLPDTYRKGFYSFYINGTVQSHYTTSEKLVIFNRTYKKVPQFAAMSGNEQYLLAYRDGRVSVAHLDNPFPEISLSSLWQKVWYESYPEPEFVWQTTSADNEFEAKFSLIPIAFGTLKAAAFAMLFAIPIAVLGAIYTAYFMTARMRRIVKPSIELMEALPTVIIGFLAGLWFAPLVERHLVSVLALLICLPLSTIVIGGVWHLLPSACTRKFANGWHAALLMPVILVLVTLIVYQGANLEAWFFEGDVRAYLANQGIDFDQRNALVVGFAMGFAVIPTIFTIAEDAIFSVPKHLSDGSLALGATAWQTLTHVVLLTASPGIFSAIMMGLGRAVGETMIVLMATGNTPIMDWNILEGMRTLSATIAVEMPESEVGSSHYRILFLAALLLLVFTFAVNSLAEWVRQRLRDRYRAL